MACFSFLFTYHIDNLFVSAACSKLLSHPCPSHTYSKSISALSTCTGILVATHSFNAIHLGRICSGRVCAKTILNLSVLREGRPYARDSPLGKCALSFEELCHLPHHIVAPRCHLWKGKVLSVLRLFVNMRGSDSSKKKHSELLMTLRHLLPHVECNRIILENHKTPRQQEKPHQKPVPDTAVLISFLQIGRCSSRLGESVRGSKTCVLGPIIDECMNCFFIMSLEKVLVEEIVSKSFEG